MKICDRIQQSIAEKGLEFVERSGAAREHLQSCAQCTQFLKSFTELQSGIEQLPEHDAPDALVEQTLQDVANAGAPERKSARTKTRRSRLAPAMASATVILAMLGSTYHLVVPVDRAETKPPAARVAPGPGEFEDKEVAPINEIVEEQVMQDGDRVAASGGIVPKSKVEATEQESARRRAGLTGQSRANESLADEKSLARNYDLYGMVLAPEEPAARNQPGSEPPTVRESGAGTALEDHRLDLALLAQVDAPARNDGRLSEQIAKHGARSQLQPLEAAEVDKRDIGLSAGDDTIDILDRAADLNSRLEITVEPDPATEPESAARAGGKPPGQSRGAIAPAMPPQSNPAKRFLTELERREGLAFQPATGYWANTYVPGDPAMRLLQARLASWDRGAMKLDTAAQPIWQPFDLPVSAALGVHLQADKRAIAGPSRLRVQIGLQASRRRSGQRPAVNVGVVLDLRDAAGKRSAHEFRALLVALAKARQPGDRFALTVAGRPGGLVLTPDQFRHGPLTVALRELVASDVAKQSAAGLDLTQATALAARTLQRHAQTDATLGASQVLLVSGASIAAELHELRALAHANAIDGIPLSFISVGGAANLDDVDRLVLAGQGSRRILTSAAQAEGVIDEELYSTSRVVARAVRLRIRLAPGVKLVDVPGSRRLSEPQAQRVREAEQGIDQRLSRNLGIKADRGADEQGIQIVIPAMEAGTSHVVLLDVLTDRAGPIADVTVRYKDLVYLRNGVSRAQLTIDRGTQAPGPLERNVLKNLVALELANTARQASMLLAQGNPAAAASTLIAAQELLTGLRQEIGEWQTDEELAADETMLAEYISLLQSQAIADARQRQYLTDSLHLSAFRKLLPTDQPPAAAAQ